MYRRIVFIMLLGFFTMSIMLLVILLNMTGIVNLGQTVHEHHIYLNQNTSGEPEHLDSMQVQLAAGPLFFAGHSAPGESGEITFRGHHYDSILRMFNLQDEAWSPGHQTHGYYGIDVSHWQNAINWSQVEADSLPHKIHFSLIKATQGRKSTDPYFQGNWKAAGKAGILRGAYHFYQYKDPPLDQAKHYIRQVNLKANDILPIIDVELDCTGCSRPEISNTLLIQNLKIYLGAIEDHFQVKPIIYTYEAFYESHLKGHFDDYIYWMAKFSSKAPKSFVVKADSTSTLLPEIAMWQFTDSGKVKGIAGKTDMSFLPATLKAKILIQP
ncbi:Glycosyl hydrolases family 25 [Cyclobacterium lianum]|uniref:Glycosyl hydrolases family 25 n=2 Tax=Cyclobacterium lianum TaxID=388280 RepID=A0A1M7NGB7_9BACT|nr:Glycosyl hydrolases family 25 [Cyclobacterium lianum]